MDQVQGIVRNVAGLAGTTELAITNSAVVRLPRREVLMLGHARVRHRLLTIIHHGAALFPTVCYCTKNEGTPYQEVCWVSWEELPLPLDGRTTRHASYWISQRKRRRVEDIFGWMKSWGGLRRTRFRGIARVQLHTYLIGAAYKLLRLSRLRPIPG